PSSSARTRSIRCWDTSTECSMSAAGMPRSAASTRSSPSRSFPASTGRRSRSCALRDTSSSWRTGSTWKAAHMLTMFDYEFMRNAFYACGIVGVVAGSVGYFLVLRGQTFAGHALAHVGFPGATGAGLIGISPFFGLAAFTVLAGIGIGIIGERAHRDVAVGIVLTLALGLGLLFLHFYSTYAGEATSVLFGNVLGISIGEVRLLRS